MGRFLLEELPETLSMAATKAFLLTLAQRQEFFGLHNRRMAASRANSATYLELHLVTGSLVCYTGCGNQTTCHLSVPRALSQGPTRGQLQTVRTGSKAPRRGPRSIHGLIFEPRCRHERMMLDHRIFVVFLFRIETFQHHPA
jgi:hypothetical protein